MRTASKIMPPILLCWPTTSEIDVGGMTVEAEPSFQYSIPSCCQQMAEWGAVWDNGVSHSSASETKGVGLNSSVQKKNAGTDIHWCLLNVYGDQTVSVSTVRTVRQWVVCFNSGNSEMKDKLCSRRPCTAVTPWNEECLDPFIHSNWLIVLTMLKTTVL